jgi:hypothetical protein
MPYKVQVPNLPGGMVIEIEKDTQMEVFEEVHFWMSLPTICPVDNTPTRLLFKNPKEFKYYGLLSTGFPVFELQVSQHLKGGTMYVNNEWVLFDGTKEIVVWKNGKITPDGLAITGRSAKQNGRAVSKPATKLPASVADREPPPADDDPSLWEHDGGASVEKIRAKTILEISTLALQAFPPRGMADKEIEEMLVLWASGLDELPDGFMIADLSVEQGQDLMEALAYRIKVAGLVPQAYEGKTLPQLESKLAMWKSGDRTPWLLGLTEDEKAGIVTALEKKIADAKK